MRTLADSVVEHIRGEIFSGRMRPGAWYSVTRVAHELEVSRSPVREGLLRLEEAGLIKFSKNRGFQVVQRDPSDVAEIFAVRLGIEPAAAFRAAAARTEDQLAECDELVSKMGRCAESGKVDDFFGLDRALHRLIMKMGHADRGQRLVEQLRLHTRVLGHSTAGSSRTLPDILDEHRPIIAAIRSGDGLAARSHMREHLVITGKLLLRQAVVQAEQSESMVEVLWRKHVGGL